jgi:hypothetical protein
MTSDTYAVQHPGRPSPVAIQSVCGHLMSLCLVLEKGEPYSAANRALEAAVQEKIDFVWLTPPRSLGPITIVDVSPSASASEHAEQVRAWAESTWSHGQSITKPSEGGRPAFEGPQLPQCARHRRAVLCYVMPQRRHSAAVPR